MASIVKHIVINLLEKKFRTSIVLLTVLLSTLVLFLGLSLNEILNDTYSTMLDGTYGDSNTTSSRDEETFKTTMMLAIVIIVMISAYIISSLTKLITVERMPVVGTFRSIGATKNMINRILILEFLFYGIIGATLGIIFGVLLLPFVADFFNGYKEFCVETKVSYSAFYMVIAFLFGMIFPPLISFFQIIKVNKRPLKEIILNTPHTAQTRSILSTVIGVLLIFATFTLYYLNQADNLVLSFLSVLFLFIAIVLLMPPLLNLISKLFSAIFAQSSKGEVLLGIKNIGNNKIAANNSNMIIVVFILLMMMGMITTGLDQYLNQSLKKDYDVVISEFQDNEINYEEINNINGVTDMYTQYVSIALSNVNGQVDEFGVLGVDDIDSFDSFYSGITFIDDAKEQLNSMPNGLILDEYQKERYGLKVGDTIKLQPLDSQLQPLHENSYIDVVVAGFMESSGFSQNRSTVIVNLSYFNNHFEGTFNQLNLKIDEDVSAEEVKNNISIRYANSQMTVKTFDELLDSQLNTINTLLSGITFTILLGLLIGLLGISNNLQVSFIQRKKEYAVLYSVCMSRGQLIKVLFTEMLMTFFSIVVIGLLGSLAMNIVMTKLLYAIGLRIDYQFNIQLFVILCGVILLLLLLSTIPIIRKIYRMDIVQSLRFE